MKYTILVNRQNKFKENYLSKINLVKTMDADNKEVLAEEETYNAYLELKKYLETNSLKAKQTANHI